MGRLAEGRDGPTMLAGIGRQDTCCLESWQRTTGQQFDYVAVRITKDSAALLAALKASGSYQPVYQNGDFAIFAVRP